MKVTKELDDAKEALAAIEKVLKELANWYIPVVDGHPMEENWDKVYTILNG